MGSRGIFIEDAFYPVLQVASRQQLRHEVGMGVHQYFLLGVLQVILVMAKMKELVHKEVEGYLVVHFHNAFVQIDC